MRRLIASILAGVGAAALFLAAATLVLGPIGQRDVEVRYVPAPGDTRPIPAADHGAFINTHRPGEIVECVVDTAPAAQPSRSGAATITVLVADRIPLGGTATGRLIDAWGMFVGTPTSGGTITLCAAMEALPVVARQTCAHELGHALAGPQHDEGTKCWMRPRVGKDDEPVFWPAETELARAASTSSGIVYTVYMPDAAKYPTLRRGLRWAASTWNCALGRNAVLTPPPVATAAAPGKPDECIDGK